MCDMAANQQRRFNKLSPLKIEMIIHKNLTNTYRRLLQGLYNIMSNMVSMSSSK